jgi:hypothetical protein
MEGKCVVLVSIQSQNRGVHPHILVFSRVLQFTADYFSSHHNCVSVCSSFQVLH